MYVRTTYSKGIGTANMVANTESHRKLSPVHLESHAGINTSVNCNYLKTAAAATSESFERSRNEVYFIRETSSVSWPYVFETSFCTAYNRLRGIESATAE